MRASPSSRATMFEPSLMTAVLTASRLWPGTARG
jgi:hypothetical protein